MPNPFAEADPKFSFIMPVYKKNWQYLAKSIGTIADSDYPNVEVIVVFDGENNKGQAVLKEIVNAYPDLAILSQTIVHGGAPKARNAGAALATGDFLSFLDPDVYLLPETIRAWANAFAEHPDKDVVWGHYDILMDNQPVPIGGSVPRKANGQPEYWAFRYSNYCSGMFPIRKSAFIGWDESVISLQDWDMWIRMLKVDNYEGKQFLYIPYSFAVTEPPREGGISDDSAKHWQERVKYVKAKNDIPLSDICVVSHGAPSHGITVAKLLGADYLPMPSYKTHEYELIYLLGFYNGVPQSAGQHLAVFAEPGHVRDLGSGYVEVMQYTKAKKVIHWIGTDVVDLRWKVSFEKLKILREWFKTDNVTNISEFQPTHDELAEVGIETSIIPMPPRHRYTPLPLPEGQFTVAIYENATQNMYKEDLMQQVARALPDIQFYFFGDESKKGQKTDNTEHLGFIAMQEWLPKWSCCLRVTVHDGLPLGPLEFLMAGRNVVTNVAIDGAIRVEATKASIIEGLRQAQKQPLAENWPKYWYDTLDPKRYQEAIFALLPSQNAGIIES